jgi:hypothetical protein
MRLWQGGAVTKSRKAVLVKDENLSNCSLIQASVASARAYCREHRLAPPPFPEDVDAYAPCAIEISEWVDERGKRVGRLIVLRGDTVLSDAEWAL